MSGHLWLASLAVPVVWVCALAAGKDRPRLDVISSFRRVGYFEGFEWVSGS